MAKATAPKKFDWDKLTTLLDERNAAPPDGAILATELAVKKKVTVNRADKMLRDLVATGIMQTGLFNSNGHRRKYFWLATQ